MIDHSADVIAADPEVRQARVIADAARNRLVACMTGPHDALNPAEAQRMLDAFRDAEALAADAEDRVLVHRGLLTSAEADRRAARRRAATVTWRADRPASAGGIRAGRPPTARRGRAGRVLAGGLALAVLLAVGAALGRRLGLRPPPARW